MNWITALQVAGPSAIAAWVFYYIFLEYFKVSQVFRDSLLLNIIFIVVVFLFCCFMGWLWTRTRGNEKNTGVTGLEIRDNKVKGSMNVGVGQEVSDSKLNNNDVDGDFNVGGKG